jgi:hypothetical protein
MKKKTILLTILLSSLTSISQSYFRKDIVLDLDSVEMYFDTLYLSYLDSTFGLNATKKTKYAKLDYVSYCQLNYLKTKDFISHKQTNSELASIGDRFRFFYKYQSKKIAEVTCLSHKKNNEKEMALHILNKFLNSPEHKEILEDSDYIYFNFKFAIHDYGYVLCVGTFSSGLLRDKN